VCQRGAYLPVGCGGTGWISGGSSHSIATGGRTSALAITSSTSDTGIRIRFILHVVRDLGEILLVVLRDEHRLDAGRNAASSFSFNRRSAAPVPAA